MADNSKDIITLIDPSENPVEYKHTSKKSVIVQKEIGAGRDCLTFSAGVKNSLREDCDILVIGEIRDRETMEAAIETAESGHLVIGTLKVAEVAKELGYQNTEEVLVLEHIVIAHHGQLQYGSARKPLTAEALLIWYLDTIDSKFQVIGDELSKVAAGSFTDSIPVLDKMRLYKTHLGEEDEQIKK